MSRLASPDAKAVTLLVVWFVGIFGLVHNPYWVPTGDSEVFLVGARNFANGDGLTFLGERLAVVPPGWPLVLAAMMSLGANIAVLKGFQIVAMSGGLLCCYAILRNILAPKPAAVAVGLSALATPLYPLTFWLHSDALFMLIGSAATLLAMRCDLATRRGGALFVGVALLVVAAVAARWAAMIYVVMAAAALLSSRSPRPRVIVGGVGLGVIALGTYLGLRLILSDGGGGTAALANAEVPGLFVRERPDLSLVGEYVNRVSRLPAWFAWTFFVPMRAIGGTAGLLLNSLIGGLVLGLVLFAGWRAAKRQSYIYFGAVAYVLVLCLAWPHVNNRYVVPVIPFVVAGVFDGLRQLRSDVRLRSQMKAASRILQFAFVVAFMVVNGAMYLVDVWVARSPSALDFYARYEAGVHLPLIEAADELRQRPDRTSLNIAVSHRYENLNERWEYPTARRELAYVADVNAFVVPKKLTGWGVKKLQQWARDHAIDYYVHQNPTVPGRFWHFRLTREEHGRIMGDLPGPHMDAFALYEMRDHALPGEPPRRWLDPLPMRPLHGERLERLAREVPHLKP